MRNNNPRAAERKMIAQRFEALAACIHIMGTGWSMHLTERDIQELADIVLGMGREVDKALAPVSKAMHSPPPLGADLPVQPPPSKAGKFSLER